jgi:hypothetical protein
MTYRKKRALELNDEIQKCPRCGGWYSKHSAVPCFACAVGAHPDSKGYHPELACYDYDD